MDSVCVQRRLSPSQLSKEPHRRASVSHCGANTVVNGHPLSLTLRIAQKHFNPDRPSGQVDSGHAIALTIGFLISIVLLCGAVAAVSWCFGRTTASKSKVA